jgi:hypothetical protein
MMFKRTGSFASGTSLCCTLDHRTVVLSRLKILFGPPDEGIEPEKGYGWEYRFRHQDGFITTLYDRWGTPRVGALSNEQALTFVHWLAKQLDVAAEIISPHFPTVQESLAVMHAHAAIGQMLLDRDE